MPASSPSKKLEALLRDFNALCDCGGRRAGTASERDAIAFAAERLGELGAVRAESVLYAGWRLEAASLSLQDGTPLACHALLGSQSTALEGLKAKVIDLGRGTHEEFERHAARVPGKVVLVRHEYPFSAEHVH